MIRFTCSNCHKGLKAPDRGAGRKTTCPNCGLRLLVPATNQGNEESAESPAEKVIAHCPSCGRSISLQPQHLSITIECAKCKCRFVPALPEREPDENDSIILPLDFEPEASPVRVSP